VKLWIWSELFSNTKASIYVFDKQLFLAGKRKELAGIFNRSGVKTLKFSYFLCLQKMANLDRSHVYWDQFIWDPVHLRPVHLRPHSFYTYLFETTIIWDYNHLRPVHLRPHSHETFSFDTTFILRHIKVKLFWFTVNHILWSTFHFFTGDLKFCKVSLHFRGGSSQ